MTATSNGGSAATRVLSVRTWVFSTIVLICAVVGIVTSSPSLNAKMEKNVVGEYIGETGFYQSIRTTREDPLVMKKTEFQTIEIHESAKHYGKILVLDGVLQLTERDASHYNEMMAHIPMFAHPGPKRVLVIGGGDGYVLREVLKHASVEKADHVELDAGVIEVAKEHFPQWTENGRLWEDPRVTLHIADGAKFVADAPSNTYDVIIQDSSDPDVWVEGDGEDEDEGSDGKYMELPSAVLYAKSHMENIHRILTPGGFYNMQAECFAIPGDMRAIRDWYVQAKDVGFASAQYGSMYISSYPTGQIGFLLCQKSGAESSLSSFEAESVQARFDRMEATHYYQPKLQKSSFDLPLWVERAVYGDLDKRESKVHSDEL